MTMSNTEFFDFIIVGAGSAGSVLANKLSANGLYTVLVLEKGPKDKSPLLSMPKGFGALLTGKTYVSRYSLKRNTSSTTEEVWLRGKTLGGSSAVNGMIWLRPQPEQLEMLAATAGSHWNWKTMQPYFDELDGKGIEKGLIPITRHNNQYAITQAFIDSSVTTGLPRITKMAALGQEGSGYLHFNIDKKGKRYSAAKAFLSPLKKRINVKIETQIQVNKLIFEAKRATSVLAQRNGKSITYKAKREIIVCAGALESPQILQRSGIGPATLLNSLNIPIIYANDNVGNNLREHLLLGLNFLVKNPKDSENNQYSGWQLLSNLIRYAVTGKGPMAQSPCHAATFMCSSVYLDNPDIKIMFNPFSRENNNFSNQPGVSIVGYPIYPKSTGIITIQSANPELPPLIQPNYLSDKEDKSKSIAAVRYIRNLVTQPQLASKLLTEMPHTLAAQSDDEIVALYLAKGQAGFHTTGTCAMGQDINQSVVDGNTKVHGVTGLRVVDCSIFPQMLSAVTNASIMGIAMRAADIILEDQQKDSL